MTEYITEALLWLFVMNVGIAFGAGLFEQRIILPQWFSRLPESGLRVDSEAMRRTDAGRKLWAYVTTVPLTLLTLTSLAVGWQNTRCEVWLVAQCGCDYSRGTDRNLLLFYSHCAEADAR